MNKFLKSYWYIFVAYGIVLVGVIYAWTCTFSCEELGCLACVVVGILGLYAAAIFSIIVIVVEFVRGKASRRLWWLAPIILIALYGWVFTLLN